MPEPTFLVRVGDYLQAVLWQWLTVILLVLGLLQLAPLLLPSSGRFVEWVQRQRRAFRALTLGVFVIANFLVFDQDQRDLRALRISPKSIDWGALPKSLEGLRPGQLWNNRGVPSIVQPPGD
jgi:hypothetical protein